MPDCFKLVHDMLERTEISNKFYFTLVVQPCVVCFEAFFYAEAYITFLTVIHDFSFFCFEQTTHLLWDQYLWVFGATLLKKCLSCSPGIAIHNVKLSCSILFWLYIHSNNLLNALGYVPGKQSFQRTGLQRNNYSTHYMQKSANGLLCFYYKC